jgi:hypothetical protein
MLKECKKLVVGWYSGFAALWPWRRKPDTDTIEARNLGWEPMEYEDFPHLEYRKTLIPPE